MCLARSSPTVLTWFTDASSSGLQHRHSGTLMLSGASTPSKPRSEDRPPTERTSKRGAMRAVYIERFGEPDVLTYGDRPDPVPAADEVLIDVAAASVNAADWKQRTGSHADLAFPHILSRDVSGTVACVPRAVVEHVGAPCYGTDGICE